MKQSPKICLGIKDCTWRPGNNRKMSFYVSAHKASIRTETPETRLLNSLNLINIMKNSFRCSRNYSGWPLRKLGLTLYLQTIDGNMCFLSELNAEIAILATLNQSTLKIRACLSVK